MIFDHSEITALAAFVNGDHEAMRIDRAAYLLGLLVADEATRWYVAQRSCSEGAFNYVAGCVSSNLHFAFALNDWKREQGLEVSTDIRDLVSLSKRHEVTLFSNGEYLPDAPSHIRQLASEALLFGFGRSSGDSFRKAADAVIARLMQGV